MSEKGVETYTGIPWKGERLKTGALQFTDTLPPDYPEGWPKCPVEKPRPPMYAREAMPPPGLDKPKGD